MKIGYARVSTATAARTGKNLSLQLDALEKAGCEKIYQEKVSGSLADRPELSKLMEMIRVGDTLPGRRCGHLEVRPAGPLIGSFDWSGV